MNQDQKILFIFWKKFFFCFKKFYIALLLYVYPYTRFLRKQIHFSQQQKKRSRFIKPSSVNFVILGPNVPRLFFRQKVLTINMYNKIPIFFNVIGTQIHFEVTKILRILPKKFCAFRILHIKATNICNTTLFMNPKLSLT